MLARRMTSSSGGIDALLLIVTLGLWLPMLILRSRDESAAPFRCSSCGTALRPHFVPGQGTRWELARSPIAEEVAARRRNARTAALVVGGLLLALVLAIALVVWALP